MDSSVRAQPRVQVTFFICCKMSLGVPLGLGNSCRAGPFPRCAHITCAGMSIPLIPLWIAAGQGWGQWMGGPESVLETKVLFLSPHLDAHLSFLLGAAFRVPGEKQTLPAQDSAAPAAQRKCKCSFPG